jgi:ABC-type multidrug transport system ATPase subunit
MWKVIARMSTQDARCSVILTTHSMEEAEALCTRIGISKSHPSTNLTQFDVLRR